MPELLNRLLLAKLPDSNCVVFAAAYHVLAVVGKVGKTDIRFGVPLEAIELLPGLK